MSSAQQKHTPGPWIAGKKSSVVGIPVIGHLGRVICNAHIIPQGDYDIKVPGDKAFNAESAANARLIAAAPDMLDVLKEVISCGYLFDDMGKYPKEAALAQKIRAAIARATKGV